MNTTTLQEAQKTVERSEKRANTARRKRDAVVVIALCEGWTHAQIAAATGLTRGRIGQIAMQPARDETA